MNKTTVIIATLVLLVLIVSGALIYTNFAGSKPESSSNIPIVDDEGTSTTLASTPQRIVSLAPSNTQILFAIGAGPKVVGVTDYDQYPYNFSAWIAAGNMTSIGGFSTPNKEVIASLHPDLILATPINDPDVVTLRGLGDKVLVLNPVGVAGILKDIEMVGRATGNEQNATATINAINTQINTITAKIAASNEKKPLVYYEVWNDPLMSIGETSFISDVIVKAGGQNIFENETQQYPTVSSEIIVQMNPDVILLPSNMANPGTPPFYGSVAQVEATPGRTAINAVKNNRVIVVDGDLFAEAGPRVGAQIAAAAAAFYPDLFNSTS